MQACRINSIEILGIGIDVRILAIVRQHVATAKNEVSFVSLILAQRNVRQAQDSR